MNEDKRERERVTTTLPEQDGEGDNAHTGQNPTAKHLSINLVSCLLVSHLEICRPKPHLRKNMSIVSLYCTYIISLYHCIIVSSYLTTTVANPVHNHTGEYGEALEDLEEAGGGEESRHGW